MWISLFFTTLLSVITTAMKALSSTISRSKRLTVTCSLAPAMRAIVETYIATAEPVGSKAVAQLAGLDVSTATIRNEMADLTEQGYLEQPHTSAASHFSVLSTHILRVLKIMYHSPRKLSIDSL